MKTTQENIRLPRFGYVSGLLFEDGGAAEVKFLGLEVKRILEAWEEHERGKHKSDERILAALRLLVPKARKLNIRLVAEVPIAQRRANLVPVID